MDSIDYQALGKVREWLHGGAAAVSAFSKA